MTAAFLSYQTKQAQRLLEDARRLSANDQMQSITKLEQENRELKDKLENLETMMEKMYQKPSGLSKGKMDKNVHFLDLAERYLK